MAALVKTLLLTNPDITAVAGHNWQVCDHVTRAADEMQYGFRGAEALYIGCVASYGKAGQEVLERGVDVLVHDLVQAFDLGPGIRGQMAVNMLSQALRYPHGMPPGTPLYTLNGATGDGIHLCLAPAIGALASAIADGCVRRGRSPEPQIYVPDMATYVRRNVLRGYERTAQPSKLVHVKTGLSQVSLTNVVLADGYFDVVLWLNFKWQDGRLSWDESQYGGRLELDPDAIWVPAFLFANAMSLGESSGELYRSYAEVQHDGTVRMTYNYRARFLCDGDMGRFPFDTQPCRIEIWTGTNADRVQFDTSLGFFVEAEDDVFTTKCRKSSELRNITGFGAEVTLADQFTVTKFQFCFERVSFGWWLRLIVPALLINVVGFASFWIASPGESIALGVTTLLCTLALRDSVELPPTTYLSWVEQPVELFLIINIGYQVIVMLLGFIDYSAVASRKLSFMQGRTRARARAVKDKSMKAAALQARRARSVEVESTRTASPPPSPPAASGLSDLELVAPPPHDQAEGHEPAVSRKRRIKKQTSLLPVASMHRVAAVKMQDEAESAASSQVAGLTAAISTLERSLSHMDSRLENALGRLAATETRPTTKAMVEASAEEAEAPGDLIGRWVVLPSYFFVMCLMLVNKGHHLFAAAEGCSMEEYSECSLE